MQDNEEATRQQHWLTILLDSIMHGAEHFGSAVFCCFFLLFLFSTLSVLFLNKLLYWKFGTQAKISK